MKTLLFIASLFILNMSMAQNYDELRILFADEEYEKLLKVAERHTMSDKTKNDPEPYIWLSKALFAMSKDETYANMDKYKKAFNDCLGWLGKYYKKDKELSIYNDHLEFFIDVKNTLFELIEADIAAENYAKANSNVTKILKASPNNFGQYFLLGAIGFHKKDNNSARDNWKKAEAMFAEVSNDDIENWELPDQKILALGIMESAKCHSKKKPELAKSLMDRAAEIFTDKDDFEFFWDYYESM